MVPVGTVPGFLADSRLTIVDPGMWTSPEVLVAGHSQPTRKQQSPSLKPSLVVQRWLEMRTVSQVAAENGIAPRAVASMAEGGRRPLAGPVRGPGGGGRERRPPSRAGGGAIFADLPADHPSGPAHKVWPRPGRLRPSGRRRTGRLRRCRCVLQAGLVGSAREASTTCPALRIPRPWTGITGSTRSTRRRM